MTRFNATRVKYEIMPKTQVLQILISIEIKKCYILDKRNINIDLTRTRLPSHWKSSNYSFANGH